MKCALITGGSKGIGRAIACLLGKEHQYHLLLNYSKDDQSASETLEFLTSQNISVELLKFDVSNKEKVDVTILNWQKQNPESYIEVLVNNAGVKNDSLFYWMSEEQWDEVIGISLKGMFNVTKAVLPSMINRKYGRIINIASISASRGIAGQTNYSAAKAGIIGATKSLAHEIGRMKITANVVAPGFIETEMTELIDKNTLLKLIPMARFGKSEEVAHLVSFLVSPNASYISGEVIHVSGGLSA